MISRCSSIVLILGFVFVANACANDREDGFVPLFDGETLHGWKQLGGKAEYGVKDGAIVGTSAPDTPNSFLCTEKSYGNFILELDYKVDSGLNSGVQIRSEYDKAKNRVFGYQVEIDPSPRSWSGGIYDEARRGWLYDLKNNPEARKAFKQNDWNHYRIECRGDSIKTWINGVAAADLRDAKTLQGFIGFQVHSIGKDSGPLQVRFRNIRICPLATSAHVPYEANWQSLDARPCPQWFLDAKFGIFIHWGVYSVPAWGKHGDYAEWYWNHIHDKKPDNPWWQFHVRNFGKDFEYQDFAPRFRAELFDADKWADLFARSGAKYIVPTSKHHDGFCLWPSAEASKTWGRPWNAVEIGPKRDLMQALADATRKRGLKFGLYYSLYEWYNPLWLSDRERYASEHMFPQFKDVVTRYKPAIIFSDGEWELTSKQWKSEELLAWLFNESPCKDEVVIDDRWGKETKKKHGSYWTTEYTAGLKDDSHPWEESRGMAYSYGYNRDERIDDYKSGREFILVLCDLVSRGGNLLLDIGPASDGTIPVIMEQRLLEMGDWLRVNGEAIYGTRYAGRSCQWTEGKRPEQQFGQFQVKYKLMEQIGQKAKGDLAVKQAFFTKKADAIYAITAGWPGKELVLHDIKVPEDATVTMLGVPGALATKIKDHTLTIFTPNLGPDEAPCQYAYAFKITKAELLPEAVSH